MTSNTGTKIHNVGLIGTGGRGRMLAKCIQLDDPSIKEAMHRQLRGLPAPIHWHARVVAAADPVEDSRTKATTVLPENCPVYDDPQRVVEHPEIEVVFVVTTSTVHAEWAVAAMEAGKDVICDKPMATTIEDCDRICEAVQRTGQIFGLSMQNRYGYWATTMEDLVRSGDLGELKMMWCHEFRCPFWARPTTGNWMWYMEPSGGPFIEKNSHHWDLFNWWVQAPATRVFAQTQNTGSHRPGDIWDCGWANVEYASGVIASLGLSLMTRFKHSLTMGLIGTNGWAESIRTPDGGTVRYQDNTYPQEKIYRADLPEILRIGHAGAEVPMLNHLFECIECRTQPDTDCWWGRESIIVGLAAQRSADQRRAIEVDELRQESTFPDTMPEYARVEAQEP